MAERKGIDPRILELFISPDPDLDRLTREPGGVAGEWQQTMVRVWDLVRQQKPWKSNRSLAINRSALPPVSGFDSLVQMAGRGPFREVSFPLSPPNDQIHLYLRITEPGTEETVHGTLEAPYIFVEMNNSSMRHDLELLFRTDAWIGNKWNRLRWFIAPTNPAEVNPLLVSCVGAILDLGEEYFAMHNYVPSPS